MFASELLMMEMDYTQKRLNYHCLIAFYALVTFREMLTSAPAYSAKSQPDMSSRRSVIAPGQDVSDACSCE
jgi:hypothetical protein